jgi:hypothetical protein
MSFDETGDHCLAGHGQDAGLRTNVPSDIVRGANSGNPVASYGDCFRRGTLRVNRNDSATGDAQIGRRLTPSGRTSTHAQHHRKHI